MLNTAEVIHEEVQRMAERQEANFRGAVQTGLRTMREIQESIADLRNKIAIKESQLAAAKEQLLALTYEPVTAESLGL